MNKFSKHDTYLNKTIKFNENYITYRSTNSKYKKYEDNSMNAHHNYIVITKNKNKEETIKAAGVVVVRDVRLGWGEEWVRQGCGEEWLFLEVYCAGSQVGPLQGLETTSQT